MSWWDPLVDLFGEGSPQVDSGGDGLFDFDFDFEGSGPESSSDFVGDESIYSAPVDFGDESIYSAPVGGQPDLERETARAASMRARGEPPSTLTRLLNALSDVAPRLARGFEGAKAGGRTAISLFNPPDMGSITPLRIESPASLALPEAPASRAFTPYNPEASTPVGAIERLLRGGRG